MSKIQKNTIVIQDQSFGLKMGSYVIRYQL